MYSPSLNIGPGNAMDDWKTIVSFSDGVKASDMSVSKSADCQLELKIAGRH